MAESQAVIRLNATDDGATSTIQKVGSASDSAAGSSNNLKKELRDLQKQLASLDPNSKAFQELSVRAGQVKDQINDAAEAVRANAGNAFEGLSNNAGLLTDRLLNLDFEGVASAARGLGGSIGRIDFKSLTAGIGQAGQAFASLGKALITNPIFLLAASLALIVSYWDDIKAAAVSVSAEEERNLQIKRSKAEASNKELQNLKAQDNILKLQGKSEEYILRKKLQKAQETVRDTKNSLEGEILKRRAQEATERKFYDATKAFLTWTQAPIVLLLNVVDGVLMGLNAIGLLADDTYQAMGDLSDGLLDWQTKFLFDPDATKAENDKFIEEQTNLITSLENEAAGYELALKDIDKSITSNKTKELKTQVDKAETAAEDIQKIQEEQYQKQLDQFDKEARQIDEKYADLKTKAQGNKDELAALEVLYQAEISDLNKRQAADILKQQIEDDKKLQEQKQKNYELAIANQKAADQLALEAMQDGLDKELALRAAKFDADIAAAEGNAEAQKLITEKYIKDVQDIEEKAQAESLKKRLDNIQTWGKLTADAFGAIADLDKAFRKEDEKNSRAAFNRNKAYSIAQAIVQTGLAVTAALTAGGNPIKLATGRQFVEAGIAAAVGLAQVATIAKTQYNAGGTSGGGGGGSTSIPTASAAGGGGGGGVAQFNPLNTNFVNNRPGQVSQTYVLAGDVANAQEARNRVQDLARL